MELIKRENLGFRDEKNGIGLFLLILSSCASQNSSDPNAVISMQIIDRHGFIETISNKERLRSFETTDFLTTQPFQKVLRIYGRNSKGKACQKSQATMKMGGYGNTSKLSTAGPRHLSRMVPQWSCKKLKPLLQKALQISTNWLNPLGYFKESAKCGMIRATSWLNSLRKRIFKYPCPLFFPRRQTAKDHSL